MKNGNTASGGPSFLTLLLLLFIGLKLGGVIDWSWWWVLSPLWGPLTVAILFACCAAAIAVWWGKER